MYRSGLGAGEGYSWCNSGNPFWDFFCGDSRTVKASVPSLPMPPTVKPPADWETGATQPAQMTINEILDRQWREWMAQNQRAMTDQANADDTVKTPGIDWVPVALVVGGIAALSLLKR